MSYFINQQKPDRSDIWRNIAAMLAEFWRAHPIAFGTLIIVTILPGLSYGVYIFVTRGLINTLVGPTSPNSPDLLTWMLIYILAILSEFILNMIRPLIKSYLQDHANYHIQKRVYKQAVNTSLVQFEDGDFYDYLQRASNDLGEKLTRLLDGILLPLWQGAIVASVAIALFAVHPWIVPIMVCGILPSLILRSKIATLVYEVRRKHTTTDRFCRYFQKILTDRKTAEEVRLFGSANFFSRQWEKAWIKRETDLLAAYKREARYGTGGGAVEWLAYGGALILIIHANVIGEATIGDLAAVLRFSMTFQRFLQGSAYSLGDLLEHTQFLGDAFEFFSFTEKNREAFSNGTNQIIHQKNRYGSIRGDSEVDAKRGVALIAEDITFTYPSATDTIIKGVSLRIKVGEKIAIVGENGAGKTTLLKLLMGLYHPDSGSIRYIDPLLGELPIDVGRSRIAAVFQDYATFDLTLKENIGMGCLEAMNDNSRLTKVVQQAGILDIRNRLSKGWESYLGKTFGEDDLSRGEWQKVALGRAFFRDADLIILDEPTSTLDPKAELSLFKRFATLVNGRTSIMISHRMGAARLADRIIVMANGQIVESGSHEELLKYEGEYSKLFKLQAHWYN